MKKAAITDYINRNGEHRIKPLQCTALIFLGSYCLFEIFYISAWVKDWTLVWEPAWVKSVVEWVIANTNTPPLNVDRKLFMTDLKELPDFMSGYETEAEFLNSPYGHSIVFFRLIKSMMFAPIILALIALMWRAVDWLGFYQIDPRYIDNARQFLWRAFLSFWMAVMFLGIFTGMIQVVEFVIDFMPRKIDWLNNFWWNSGFLFAIFYLKFLFGWFYFFKRIIFRRA